MLRTLGIVFSKIRYSALALVVSGSILSVSVWLPNTKLILQVLRSGVYTVSEKLELLGSFYFSLQTNFTLVGAVATVGISILLGMNTALFLFYLTKMRGVRRGVGASSILSIGGFVSGIFGIGCVSCGAFITTTILASLGASGLLVLLPLGGAEFGILGVVLLIWSQYLLLQHIKRGVICSN